LCSIRRRGHCLGMTLANASMVRLPLSPAYEREIAMSQRENNLIWLKDMLEHLTDSREQLEWAQDGSALRMISESMLRDLDCCRRLCESLRRRGPAVEVG
jgi:hypothetical protein